MTAELIMALFYLFYIVFDWAPCFICGTDSGSEKSECFRGLAMQAVWYVVGALAVVIIIHFDAKLLWRLTPFLYVIGLAVMLALLKYYDTALFASTGSKNWFKLGH